MKYYYSFIFLFVFNSIVFGQSDEIPVQKEDSIVDSKYREDQFYLGITYNALVRKPSNGAQSGFSSGLHLGFMRDFPINQRRNVAFAVGLGGSMNSFNSNILVYQDERSQIGFLNLDTENISYSKNRFNLYLIELPMEFRWRTSTATESKFWRIYPGFKIGYQFANLAKHKGGYGDFRLKNIDNINDLQYAVTLSAGYSVWNFHACFGLNPIFKEGTLVGNENLDMYSVKLGLMFYIL
ncbi:PorT family protein [Mangrovimonas sp. AS39]|uniref:porin family protein n=1 Tax=Mangrovimonas futianensis TaxID=2895523 RepID=UPI001E2F2996|nr:porin family protein [Mangrovimonas futianensis]MCF1190020.1 PorT family protein [Mangrovimonas futianensis]MCF1194229.1 PorT family protein [Mangrovimonas futianensis]